MAVIRAYEPIDMSDFRTSLGEAVYADNRLVIVESDYGYYQTLYFGKFSYPGDDWKGTIKSIETYADDYLAARVSGLDIATRYATVGTSVEQTYRKALAGADKLYGSDDDDYLAGYAGDDALRGNRGDDTLKGMAGDDKLYGGSGNDSLNGGSNADILYGGSGRDAIRGGAQTDLLFGGTGRDTFIFYGADGKNTIADFEDGRDTIRILDGADDYADLRIVRSGDDVKIRFADTVIFLEDTSRGQISADDFDLG